MKENKKTFYLVSIGFISNRESNSQRFYSAKVFSSCDAV